MANRRPQFVLPDEVDSRLDSLLRLAREEGNRVSRSEIVSTLIWNAPADGDALGVMIRQYRRELAKSPSVTAAHHPPGPRPLLSDQTQ